MFFLGPIFLAGRNHWTNLSPHWAAIFYQKQDDDCPTKATARYIKQRTCARKNAAVFICNKKIRPLSTVFFCVIFVCYKAWLWWRYDL